MKSIARDEARRHEPAILTDEAAWRQTEDLLSLPDLWGDPTRIKWSHRAANLSCKSPQGMNRHRYAHRAQLGVKAFWLPEKG